MIIRNITKEIILADKAKLADRFLTRLKGLLGTTKLPVGQGLIISPCNSVHTFGMKYPIDVLFINERNIIMKKVHDMAKGKMSYALKAKYVIELPAGTALECAVGDEIEVIKSSN